MNYVAGNAIVGLPALVGVVLGLKLYVEGRGFAPWIVGMLVIPVIALLIARAVMHKYPRFGSILIEIWILSAVGVTALATALIIWVGLNAPFTWIVDTSALKAEDVKAISSSFLAAISTYVALVWTKDIGDAKGFFWPSTQFKSAMALAFKRLTPEPPGTAPVYQATYQDVVENYGNLGWKFSARRQRAKIFADYLGV
jgi:hypothetical protein